MKDHFATKFLFRWNIISVSLVLRLTPGSRYPGSATWVFFMFIYNVAIPFTRKLNTLSTSYLRYSVTHFSKRDKPREENPLFPIKGQGPNKRPPPQSRRRSSTFHQGGLLNGRRFPYKPRSKHIELCEFVLRECLFWYCFLCDIFLGE